MDMEASAHTVKPTSSNSLRIIRRTKLKLRLKLLLSKWSKLTTVNFAYNDTWRASEKCPYSRSVVIPDVSYTYTVGLDFALGMEILSLFANCRYIHSRY